MTLSGKHIVITGGAGGMGAALAEHLLQHGAKVSAVDLDRQRLVQLQEHYGQSWQGYALDITRADDCQSVFDQICDKEGDIDILILNAGITHLSISLATPLAVVERVMNVNFMGAVNCCSAGLQSLLRVRGQLVVISSVAGFAPLFGRSAYAASKYALHGYFETLRAELRQHGVNVLMICPSFIDSQQNIKPGTDNFPGTERPGSARHVVGGSLSASQAARQIVNAIIRRKRLLLVGRVARLSYWTVRLAPRLYEYLMRRQTRGEVE